MLLHVLIDWVYIVPRIMGNITITCNSKESRHCCFRFGAKGKIDLTVEIRVRIEETFKTS